MSERTVDELLESKEYAKSLEEKLDAIGKALGVIGVHGIDKYSGYLMAAHIDQIAKATLQDRITKLTKFKILHDLTCSSYVIEGSCSCGLKEILDEENGVINEADYL